MLLASEFCYCRMEPWLDERLGFIYWRNYFTLVNTASFVRSSVRFFKRAKKSDS